MILFLSPLTAIHSNYESNIGFDMLNNDLDYKTGTTQIECERICDDNLHCVAYTVSINDRSLVDSCWIKGKAVALTRYELRNTYLKVSSSNSSLRIHSDVSTSNPSNITTNALSPNTIENKTSYNSNLLNVVLIIGSILIFL